MNRQLWKLRGLNFSYNAINGLLTPFLPLYLGEKGYSAAQIGLLMMIGPLVTIFAQPVWGYISDRYQRLNEIIFFLWGMTILSSIGVFNTNGYALALLFMTLIYFFLFSSSPLLDTLSVRVAERAGATYGSIRMFGSAGFMLLSLGSGLVLEAIGGINSIPYLFWGIWILPMLLLWRTRSEKSSRVAVVSLRDFGELLKDKNLLWFLFLIFLMIIPHRMNDGLLALHLKDLGGSDAMVGWAWALAAASEIPTFALLGRYMNRFHELALLGVVALIYTVRWLLYGYIQDPFILMFLQATHCITFAVFWIAAVQYIVRIVPDHLQSLGQSLLSMVFLGLAGIAGGYAGGFVKDWLGGAWMYYFGAVLAFASALLLLITHAYLRQKNNPAV